ncbi:MAG TPA: AAA family ATPase [Clostridiaceae bacterium]|nr:AAA family ATPase [Clostridiaceae bacterium]
MKKRTAVRTLRPRYLEIEGLQSFKELQVVDFDKLGETGLFGIFGPTGSGKSTILDAITLALYGNVQRALRGTQGIINTNSNSLKVVFAFDLVKNGTRKTYRVERTYRRKKDSENSAEARTARLFTVVDGMEIPLADKTSEVTEKVEELLGLTLDDFTRSVVLPQNKFQEFLFLEKVKKREMLERIFYLEEYGKRLSEKVSRRISIIKNELSRVQGGMSALGDISEKTLVEAESMLKAAHEMKEEIDKELKLLEVQYNESKEIWELVSELALVNDKEEKHKAVQDEIDAKKKLLESSIRAEGLVDVIKKYREFDKELENTRKELDLTCTQFETACKKLEEAKKQHQEILREVETERPKLIEERTKLLNALEMKKELDIIDQKLKDLRREYLDLREKLLEKEKVINDRKLSIEAADKKEQEYRQEIEKYKVDIDYRNDVLFAVRLMDELDDIRNEKEKIQSRYNELALRTDELEKGLKEIEKQRLATQEELNKLKVLQEAHEKAKPCERNEIIKEIGVSHELKGLIGVIKSAKSEAESVSDKLNALMCQAGKAKEDYGKSLKKKARLEAVLEELRQRVEDLREKYERNAAYMLARNLKEGEPCPVCGSKSHPEPAVLACDSNTDNIGEELKAARESLTEKEKEARNIENECIKQDEQLKSLENLIMQAKSDLAKRELEYKTLYSKLPADMQCMELDAVEEAIEAGRLQNELKLRKVEEWEVRLEEIKTDINKLNDVLSGQLMEEKSKKAELDIVRDNLDQVESALKEAESRKEKTVKSYKELAGKLNIENARDENKRIQENDRKHQMLQKQLEQLQENRKTLQRELERLTEEKQELSGRLVEVENDGKNLKMQRLKEEQKIRDIAGDNDIERRIEDIDKRILVLAQNEKESGEQVKLIEQQYNMLNTRKITLQNQLEFLNKNLLSEKSRLDALLDEKGFESVEEAENALMEKERQEALNKEIQEYENEGRNLEAQKRMIFSKLNNRSITEEEWDLISRTYEEKKMQREEAVLAFEREKNNYNAIRNNFEKWVELNRQHKEYSRKNEMLEQIQKLLKGNSFVEFISEERLRYVAREASETLGVLTKYRYALELDTDNGFIIRDNANGGVHRLVTSLSGGETFLTSLSLALALSKQIQLKGQSPLEFFFLDEGFGTLDSSLLDTVIDSLERISTSERVIGIISHVPEVRNRIARRLIVEPPSSDGSGSKVRIEKA